MSFSKLLYRHVRARLSKEYECEKDEFFEILTALCPLAAVSLIYPKLRRKQFIIFRSPYSQGNLPNSWLP